MCPCPKTLCQRPSDPPQNQQIDCDTFRFGASHQKMRHSSTCQPALKRVFCTERSCGCALGIGGSHPNLAAKSAVHSLSRTIGPTAGDSNPDSPPGLHSVSPNRGAAISNGERLETPPNGSVRRFPSETGPICGNGPA